METRYLDTRAAARRVHVCVETIRRWIKSGQLPAVRRGKHCYLIKEEDLDRMFAPVVRPAEGADAPAPQTD
jgi:excisionase family DNA binding protein